MPNLLNQENQKILQKASNIYQVAAPAKKSRRLMWSSLVLLLVVVMIGLGFFTKVILAVNSTNSESGAKVSFIEQIKHLISNPDKKLAGESNDRINILLVGIGGAGHPGSYLADTIMVVSIKPSTNEVATMSIPRDLYVDIPTFGWRKINNSIAFGMNDDYPGGGEALLAEVVTEVTGEPIHYYARIDFEGFKKVIDDLNGLDIDVDNAFTDYQYPDYNFGFQVVSFKEGINHMDGERALQYSRSRHGTNGEGSDFARSQRQQKVLFSFKEKFLSLNTFLNPAGIVSALDNLGKHNKTNMQIWEIVKLAKIADNINKDKIISLALDTSDEGLLYSDTTIDGAYILLPNSGDYSAIQYRMKNVFNTSFIAREKAKIEVQNGTNVIGLATKTANKLKGLQYNVIQISNADTAEAITTTTIYDLSGGTQPYTLVSLKNILDANIAPAKSVGMTNSNSPRTTSATNVDILIIIGQDQISTAQISRHTD